MYIPFVATVRNDKCYDLAAAVNCTQYSVVLQLPAFPTFYQKSTLPILLQKLLVNKGKQLPLRLLKVTRTYSKSLRTVSTSMCKIPCFSSNDTSWGTVYALLAFYEV